MPGASPFNPQIFGAGQRGRSVALTAQQRINAFMDLVRDPLKQDRAQISFWARPGLGGGFGNGLEGAAAYYGADPLRGKLVVTPYIYCVYGNTLYQLAANGVLTALGPLLTNSGPVYLVSNATQVGLCDTQGNWYVYQISGTSAATGLTAGNMQTFTPGALGFLGAIHCTYLDNVAVVVVPGANPLTSQQMQQSNVGDFTGWNALAFNLADSGPDPLAAVVGVNGLLFALGTSTTEVWQNLGSTPFQFGRAPTNVTQIGIAAPNSLATFGERSVCLLAQTDNGQVFPTVLSGGGYASEDANPLADDDLVATINQVNANGSLVYGTLSDAIGDSYMVDNRRFYLLSFPTAHKTWMWDSRSGAWSELTSDTGVTAGGIGMGIPTGVQGQFRGAHCVVFNRQLLFFDFADGHVYLARPTGEQDTDNGCEFPWTLVSQHLYQANKRLGLSRIQFDFQAGVGQLTGAATDPKAILEVSRDKGQTWSTPLFEPLGQFGHYAWRTIFRRLGSGFDLTLRLTVSAPVKRVLTGETPEIDVWAA